MDKSSMLIDFSSPAHKIQLASPLIPVPSQFPLTTGNPSDDPFELAEIETPDPFEAVLQCAPNKSINEQTADVEPQPSPENKTEKVLIHIHNEDHDSIKSSHKENLKKKLEPVSFSFHDNGLKKTSLESDQVQNRNETPKHCKVGLENSHNVTVIHNNVQDTLKNPLKSSVTMENDSQSQITSDFSTEESLKEVIAKRVNRCIQEVLNGKVNKKNGDNSLYIKPQNKRSLSFIGLSSASAKKECDRLNKSCTDVNDTFNLENQQPDASNGSSGFGILSPNSTDVSAEGNGDDQVFAEARKLSRTFSKLADSFRQEQESDSDDEDLMSCKPRWLYTESSEDEEEKLLKDPALNFRWRSEGSACSSPAPVSAQCAPVTNTKVFDSPALLAYKSRRSFTQLQTAHDNTQEELAIKRSISVGSQLKEVPAIPTLVTSAPVNLVKPEAQSLKLRKKNLGDVKKGPLRAVMPVESMTKETLHVAGKVSLKQDVSPEERTKKTVYAMGTPIKDNSQLNIAPMASSTPNKVEISGRGKDNTSLLVKSVPVNKRHSLEGSFGGHKSREQLPEAGARPRSSSVNSSIPRVMQVKPMRGLPLAPKSTSHLVHRASPQVNANNVHERKNSPQLKTNVNKARVLTDVKPKSPRQSKVRTAVSTISSLVRGKKSAARDKENRISS